MDQITSALPKSPFASYDIVVYFGCGLLALPLVQHYYLIPMDLELRPSVSMTDSPIIDSILTGLVYLFIAYVAGHAIAFASSQVIQRFADSLFGKTSRAVVWEALTKERRRRSRTQALIKGGLSRSLERDAIFLFSVRLFIHLPLWLPYAIFYFLGVFGFYSSRVPVELLKIASRKLKQLRLPEITVAKEGRWFEPLEHCVMNHHPQATARMYNYLIISGLFRSLSFLLLISIWVQGYYDLHRSFDGHSILQPMFSNNGIEAPLWQLYPTLYGAFLTCLYSFLKFQRRYVEEAIFAFALLDRREDRSCYRCSAEPG